MNKKKLLFKFNKSKPCKDLEDGFKLMVKWCDQNFR